MSVVKKVIEQKVEGYDVKTEYEFNTEDIGMCFTTTMDSALCFKHKLMKEVTESIVSFGEAGNKALIAELGKKVMTTILNASKQTKQIMRYGCRKPQAKIKPKLKLTFLHKVK